MINTLNESSLHATLKTLYATECNGKTEVEMDGKIYDIVDKDGNVTEIQTQNIAKLYGKAKIITARGKKFRIVYPIIAKKKILLFSDDGKLIKQTHGSRAKSIYSIFRELPVFKNLLLNKFFSIEALYTEIDEIRIKTKSPVQSINKKRRLKKDFLKVDKALNRIISKKILRTKNDYISLIPNTIPAMFSVKELFEALLMEKKAHKSEMRNIYTCVRALCELDILSKEPSSLRPIMYKIEKVKDENQP